MPLKLQLLVLKTADPQALKAQYELLDIRFVQHRHGNGPMHFSAQVDGLVLEIYPLPKSATAADHTTRLGFQVEDLDQTLEKLEGSNWRVVNGAAIGEFGYRAVIQDLDGRKVELTELRLKVE